MTTLAINSDNDLYFTDRRLTIISGSNTDEEILQRIKIRLRFFKDEWYLNSDHGLPYFEDILGTKNVDINGVESLFREQILDVEGVREITESAIDYDGTTRKLSYSFSAVSINNTVITEDLVVL
jgi:hypothetical protein